MPAQDLLHNLDIKQRRGSPKHVQVEQSLLAIIDEHFADGDLFYTDAQLVERLGVSRPTVRQALASLTRQGMLLRRPSIGTVVIKSRTLPRRVADGHVGVFVPDSYSEYVVMLLRQLVVECRRSNMDMHVYYTYEGESIEQVAAQVKHEADEERILVINVAPVLGILADRGYRVVCIENPGPSSPHAVVETDARMAAQIGVDYLRSLGHDRITLLVNEPATAISVQEKIEQFRASYPPGRVVMCGTQVWDNSYQAAYAHMGEVWNVAPSEQPTAIMTTSDPGAWAALRWLAERNVSVPGRVSVLGFEDVRSSRFMHPSLSTIAHPIEALARTALEVLWGAPGDVCPCLLAPRLMVRESTGPAPAI